MAVRFVCATFILLIIAVSLKITRAAPSRRLQQQGNCTVDAGAGLVTYGSCRDLSQQATAPYKAYWSVERGVLHGAVEGNPQGDNSQGGWLGLGIPRKPNKMIGASAVIVKTASGAPQGAAADTYYLGGYNTFDVKPPAKLPLNITGWSGSSDGTLKMAFQLPLSAVGNLTMGDDLPFIYAAGPLDGRGDLQQHTGMAGDTFSLGPAAAAPGPGPGLAPAEGFAATEPAMAPAPRGQQQQQQQQQQASVESAQAAAPAGEAASSPSSAVAAGPAPQGAPPGGRDCAALAPLTGLQGVRSADFQQCNSLPGAGASYQLHCTLQGGSSPTPAGRRRRLQADTGEGAQMLRAAMSVDNADGWAGFGLPKVPGQMIGAQAVIVKRCPSCPTGASVATYSLNGYAASQVVPSNALNASGLQAAFGGNRLQAVFTVPLAAGTNPASVPIIYAAGPLDGQGNLQQHPYPGGATGGTLNLRGGSFAGGGGHGHHQHWKNVHGWIMGVVFAFVLPLGAVIAHSLKGVRGTAWFQVHRALQTAGVLLAWVGFGIGAWLDGHHRTHLIIGSVVMALATLQILLGWVARPGRAHRLRRAWILGHLWLGLAVLGLALANVYIGLKLIHAATRYVVALSVVVGTIFVAGAVIDGVAFLRLPPPGRMEGAKGKDVALGKLGHGNT